MMRPLHWLLIVGLAVLAGCAPKAPPAPPKVGLKVTTQPAGAKVLLDNKPIGTTPLETQVTPDRHFVEIRLDGYERYWVPLAEKPAFNHVIEVDLHPLSAPVYIQSDPVGALVKLDGVDRGETPLTLLQVPVGQHAVTLQLTGYADKTAVLEIPDARPLRASYALDSVMAGLKVFTTPPGADVYVGENLQGTTPDDGAKPLVIHDLVAGDYPVTVSKPGYQEITQQVVLRRNEVKTVTFPAMKELPGSLRVSSQPAGAKVFNDQEMLLGVTPVTVADLPNGEVTLRIVKPGYAPETRTITISRGLVKQIDVTLTSNTGSVTFQTEPPGCKIFIDGKAAVVTSASDAPTISRIVTLQGLAPGPHRIDVNHPEFEDLHRTFMVERDKATRLGVLRPKRRWLPTHELKTVTGPVYRGILLTRYEDGSILFERAPNIKVTYKANEIVSLKPLRDEPKAGP